jgi:anti-sigma B factor antagonist
MTLTGEKREHADIVRMPLRIDAVAAESIKSELSDLLRHGSGRLLLDMSAVKFMDSTGLGVIVTALKSARAGGGKLALFALPARVRALVEVTRLHLVFDIYVDEASALAASAS